MFDFDATAVILCAGSSSRFGLGVKKQWLRVGYKPLWAFVADKFLEIGFKKVIVVGAADEIEYMRNFGDFEFIVGGATRQESLKNALEIVDTHWVCSQDAARSCVPKEMIFDMFENVQNADCVVPYINAEDTTILHGEMLDRENLMLIQTPQLSKTAILKQALQTTKEFTDDSSAIKAYGGDVKYTKGDKLALKLTTLQDLSRLKCLDAPSSDFFVGFGTDTHAFEDGKQMRLGGTNIDSAFGFKAHSDGDVLIHAVIDAILGAAGAGDIGEWFPDTSSEYKNINSVDLLQRVVTKISGFGYQIVNIDVTISLEKPKLKDYKRKIKENLAKVLQIDTSRVNIKATTGERLGFIGRGEGCVVQSVVNLKFFDWKNACMF